MRYLLFALALLGSISFVTVPTMTYADEGGHQNVSGGEHNGTTFFCGVTDRDFPGGGDEC